MGWCLPDATSFSVQMRCGGGGLARKRSLDHLALLGDVSAGGFGIRCDYVFGMGFQLAADLHAVSNPNSRSYVGVGAFQMLKRGAYEACGTHRRLAMEVIDT